MKVVNHTPNAAPQVPPMLPAVPSEPYLTQGDVAIRLKLHVKTVSRYVRLEILKGYRLGRFVYLLWSEVTAALRAGLICRHRRKTPEAATLPAAPSAGEPEQAGSPSQSPSGKPALNPGGDTSTETGHPKPRKKGAK